MIEIAAGASVVMNVIGRVDIPARAFGGVDAISAVGARARWCAIIVDIAVKNLVIVRIDCDASLGTIPDFKSIHNIVTAIDIKSLVAIRGILTINNCPTLYLRFQNNGTACSPVRAKVTPPARL